MLVARQRGLGTSFTIITARTPGSMVQVKVSKSDEQILYKYADINGYSSSQL
jgi:hypothetical protein